MEVLSLCYLAFQRQTISEKKIHSWMSSSPSWVCLQMAELSGCPLSWDMLGNLGTEVDLVRGCGC